MYVMKKHIVIVSNLFPNSDEPNRGIFIKQLTVQLLDRFNITVVCPVPWRPRWLQNLLGKEPLPFTCHIDGIKVYYVPHLIIPKILRFTYGWLMYKALMPVLKLINESSSIDLISAHWVYPDGYGAVKAAAKLSVPVTVHALGCDVNEYTKQISRRFLISKAFKNCDQVIVKSLDLEKKVLNLGCQAGQVKTILNGVDKNKFFPVEMNIARKKLNLDINKDYLLFVGNIQQEKGLVYLIDALKIARDFNGKLLIVGKGPQEMAMRRRVKEHCIVDRVEFIGTVPHHEVPLYLSAVNALCLPSLREGCPNIVLESLSCGTPVLASSVGAVPQIITQQSFGMMVPPESAGEIAAAIPKIVKIKAVSSIQFEWHSWQENADQVSEVFDGLLN